MKDNYYVQIDHDGTDRWEDDCSVHCDGEAFATVEEARIARDREIEECRDGWGAHHEYADPANYRIVRRLFEVIPDETAHDPADEGADEPAHEPAHDPAPAVDHYEVEFEFHHVVEGWSSTGALCVPNHFATVCEARKAIADDAAIYGFTKAEIAQTYRIVSVSEDGDVEVVEGSSDV